MRHVRLDDLEAAAEALEERTKGRLSAQLGLDPKTIKVEDIPPVREDPEFLNDSLNWAGCEATTDEVMRFIALVLLKGGLAAEREAKQAIATGELPAEAGQFLYRVMMVNCYLTGIQIGMLAARIASGDE